jgi:hypothetical protein
MKNKYFIIPLVLTILIVVFALGTKTVSANLAYFLRVESATATSTLSYMTPGTATTTISIDGGASALDSALLTFQYTASGTAPVLKARVEYSSDKIDWYPQMTAIGQATTTLIATPFLEYSFTLSTTTDNGGSGTSARVHGSLDIPTPTRYTRVKFYVPASGGNGALYTELTAKKQSQ